MYIVASDIGADLPKQWIVGGFHKINQSILVDGKSVVVPFDDQSLANFYTSLAHSQVKTTAMQQQEILPQLQQLVDKEGKDVLFVGFSSRLSGTATQIATCAQQVSQSGKVNVCFWDSLQASAGQALLVERALQNRQKGLSNSCFRRGQVFPWGQGAKLAVNATVAHFGLEAWLFVPHGRQVFV